MSTGKFIVLEGGEGSGKSSHIQLSADFLRQRGLNVVTTHEPGGTQLGVQLRKIILETNEQPQATPIATKAELLMFLADRAQHMAELIQPALDRGDIVLCDRFTGSTLAYQIGGRHLHDESLIRQLEAFSRDNIKPDLTIYLDLEPAIGIQRKLTQTGHVMNSFDDFSLEFHQDVHNYFQQLAQTEEQWTALQANRTLTAVQFDINQLLEKICGLK